MFDSAAEYARECGVHRTTVVEWIKKGKIKACKRDGEHQPHKIPEKEKKKIKDLKAPYPKHYQRYTSSEIYIMVNNKHLTNQEMGKMLKRSENSVCIKRCRLRKEGYDV